MKPRPTASYLSDYLSPMLVKELRQGLRAGVFEVWFLLLQGVMIFCIGLGLLARKSGTDLSFTNGLYWAMVALPLLIGQPMRGFTALGGEIQGRTIELVFLTRLSAWRIVVGKWAGLMAQGSLFVCAILPYTVLRYFLGGVNLLEDLRTLALLTLGSALAVAVTVGLSAYQTRLIRSSLLGLVIFFVFSVGPLQFGLRFLFRGLGLPTTTRLYWPLGLWGAAFFLFMLEVGAGRIAPPAENHATRKRLIGLFVLLTAPLLQWLGVDPRLVWFVAALFLSMVCLNAVCETPPTVASVTLPFWRRGRWGQFAAWWLYPGWHTGTFYTLATVATAFLLSRRLAPALWDENAELIAMAWLGTLLVPLGIIRMFLPRTRKLFLWYVGIQVVTIIVMTFSIIITYVLFRSESAPPDLVGFFPLPTLLLVLVHNAQAHWLWETALVTIVGLALIVLRLEQPFREMYRFAREAPTLTAPAP